MSSFRVEYVRLGRKQIGFSCQGTINHARSTRRYLTLTRMLSLVSFGPQRLQGRMFTMIVSWLGGGYAPRAQKPRCEPPLIAIFGGMDPPLLTCTAVSPP